MRDLPASPRAKVGHWDSWRISAGFRGIKSGTAGFACPTFEVEEMPVAQGFVPLSHFCRPPVAMRTCWEMKGGNNWGVNGATRRAITTTPEKGGRSSTP